MLLVYDRPLDDEQKLENAIAEESSISSFIESCLVRRLLIFIFTILLGILLISLRIQPLSAFGFLFSGVGWIGFLVTIVKHVAKINSQEECLKKVENNYSS